MTIYVEMFLCFVCLITIYKLRPKSNCWCLLFSGQFNFLATTLRQNDIEPMPSLSDVRQVLSLYAVLPLGMKVTKFIFKMIKNVVYVWLKISVVYRLPRGT